MRILAAAVVSTDLLGDCAVLEVSNPKEPDRERVLSSPVDVQALISTSYRAYIDNAQQTNPGLPTAAMADNLTGGFFDFGVHDVSVEPRTVFDANPLNTRGFVGRAPWDRLYPVLSNVNDALGAIDGGLEITTGPGGADETPRARAFGKFMQGITLGYLALYYDQALIVTENTDLEQMDPTAFQPYEVVADSALALLDEAIAIANANSFTIPPTVDWINGLTITNSYLVRIINSYAARLIAYMPRTWDDRAAVDWNEVIRRIDEGIVSDLAPDGLLDVWESNMRRLYARERARPSDHIRPDYIALGPADTSGAFQTWFAASSENRMPFQIRTADRRIHGATPTTRGLYFGYNAQSIWPADRGTYRWSYYFYHRHGLLDTWHTGPQVTMSLTEMRLLKAEALIRLGRAAEAVPLINVTRVANGQLPPVTIDGPPDTPGCVPRKVTGGCGSLWDALMHERNLENNGIEGTIMWWDFRGLNRLMEGTLLHFPVSGIEMENLGLPIYTFGGVGGQGAAPPPQYHRCPATGLPRC
jgi:hypothetical protein